MLGPTQVRQKINLEYISCDFCGSDNHKELFRQKDLWINNYYSYPFAFPVVQCRNCSLVFVNPRPTPESMVHFYPHDYHDCRNPEIMKDRYSAQKRFLPPLHEGANILDIGCAKGDFLHWLNSKNLHLFGCDAYSGGVRAGYQINFTGKHLPECAYPDNFFDLITAWAVLEHVHFPNEYFKETSRILKPEGRFVFLVPNFNSLMCRIAKRDDIVRHIYQYTPKSITNYLQRFAMKSEIIFDDSVFDGRGFGSFTALISGVFPKLSKWTSWLDKKIFSVSWEKKLKISGMMILSARKK